MNLFQEMEEEHSDNDDNNTDNNSAGDTGNDTSSQRRSETPSRGRSSTPRRSQSRGRSRTSWNGFQVTTEFQGFKIDTSANALDLQELVNKQLQKETRFSHLKDELLLDCGSSMKGTISNPDFVTNIRPAEFPTTMATNAGSK